MRSLKINNSKNFVTMQFGPSWFEFLDVFPEFLDVFPEFLDVFSELGRFLLPSLLTNQRHLGRILTWCLFNFLRFY